MRQCLQHLPGRSSFHCLLDEAWNIFQPIKWNSVLYSYGYWLSDWKPNFNWFWHFEIDSLSCSKTIQLKLQKIYSLNYNQFIFLVPKKFETQKSRTLFYQHCYIFMYSLRLCHQSAVIMVPGIRIHKFCVASLSSETYIYQKVISIWFEHYN